MPSIPISGTMKRTDVKCSSRKLTRVPIGLCLPAIRFGWRFHLLLCLLRASLYWRCLYSWLWCNKTCSTSWHLNIF